MKALKLIGVFGLIVLTCMGIIATSAYIREAILLRGKNEAMSGRITELERKLNIVSRRGHVHQGVTHTDNEVIVTYGEHKGYPLQLVLEKNNKRAILRVVSPIEDYAMGVGNLSTTDVLKKEVERLASLPEGCVLGSTGVKFTFAGGVPIWAPYNEMSNGTEGSCLYFAENAKFEGNIMTVQGRSEKGAYWPYDLVSK